MAWRTRAHTFLQAAGTVPGVRSARAAYLTRKFKAWPGAFLGVYGSFAEALAGAPKDARVGYDHDEFADIYDDRLFRIMPADYPVLFWLGQIGAAGARVFDFGGHIGLAFYGFERYLRFSDDTRWTVYDVPKVVAAAERFGARHPRPHMRFTTSLEGVREHDVFHASGALQYVEKPLAQQLVELDARPRHLLINKLPLTEGAGFATLQNTFHAFNPYAVFNRNSFLEGLAGLGYTLIDEWTTPGVSCHILDVPARDVPAYTGLYLRREG